MPRLLGLLIALVLAAAACSTAGTVETAAPDARDDVFPDGPSALEDPDHPDLPDPLVDTNRIISGGPPPDGIPPIDEPVFLDVDEVDFLDDTEPVLVVEVDGEVRIYPVQIMTWHEIVNDEIAGVPVTVSYCPLCNSAITYDRRVQVESGETGVLDFGTSGRLYNSALVMYDRQTESLWSHFTGQAVAGLLAGTELEFFPTATVGWAAARDANPDALVLDTDTGHIRQYGINPYPGYDDVTTSPFLFDGEQDGRLVAKARVVGIRSGDDAVAVRTEALDLPGVLEVEVAGRPLTVWRVPGTASALDTADIAAGRDVGGTGVFDRRLDGSLLAFSVEDGDIVDSGTGSTWNVLGEATSGPLEGRRLDPVEHVDTFWFAWAAFLPGTTIAPPL